MHQDVVRVYLGLGSNLGVRRGHIRYALTEMETIGGSIRVSGVYETEPHGYADQPPFLNLVARLETPLSPREVLDWGRGIELERGRVHSFRNAPRTLDVDVLLYGERKVRGEGLIVPHPRMSDRPFVLIPLLELDPGLTDPVTGEPFREQLARLAGGGYTGLREVGERLGVRRIGEREELLDEPSA